LTTRERETERQRKGKGAIKIVSLILFSSSPPFVSFSVRLSLCLKGRRPGGLEVDRVSVDQITPTLGRPLSAEKELRAGH